MGIHISTLCDWKNKFPEFSEALKRGFAPVDYEIENALRQSALGYKITVKKPIKIKEVKMKVGEGRIETERIEYTDEEVYIPPNTVAQIFWLKNRRPDKWRDKRTVEASDDALEAAREILGGIHSAVE